MLTGQLDELLSVLRLGTAITVGHYVAGGATLIM